MAKRLDESRFKRHNGRRPSGSRPLRKYYLIVCEGEKTEKFYFEIVKEQLPSSVVDIDILGEGKNTTSLVSTALQRAVELGQKTGKQYDAVWCIFDRDSFGPHLYNAAIAQCSNHDLLQAGFTNEAFELWLLLHFDLIESALGRSRYEDMLSKRLSSPKKKVVYNKTNKEQIGTIFNAGWKRAIDHAYRLDKMWGDREDHANHCPRTRVHILVEELMSMAGK